MLRKSGPVVKSVESVLRSAGSLWWERFVKEVGLEPEVPRYFGSKSHPAAWEYNVGVLLCTIALFNVIVSIYLYVLQKISAACTGYVNTVKPFTNFMATCLE